MYMSIDVAKHTNTGVAGAIGFWGQTAAGSIINPDDVLTAFGDKVLFSAAQSVVAYDNQTLFMVGSFMPSLNESEYTDGIFYTKDGGQTYGYSNWNVDTYPRYGAASQSGWIITGGTWPASSTQRLVDGYVPISQHFGAQIGDIERKALKLVEQPRGTNVDSAGYVGKLAFSPDQGETWELVYEDFDRFYFNGAHCFENTCWAVAEGTTDAYIFQSTDGGRTWAENAIFPGKSLMDIEFRSELEGWAVGGAFFENTFEAFFAHTVDGGVTWDTSETMPRAYPNGITITESGVAYASAFMQNGLSSVLAYHP